MRFNFLEVLNIIQPGNFGGGNTVQGAESNFRSVPTVPGAGTANIVTITINGGPDGGTWRLTYQGVRTASMANNESLANVQAKLNALPGIGAGGVVVTGTPGTSYVITWQAPGVKGTLTIQASDMLLTLAGTPVAAPGIVNGTPGVDPDAKGCPPLGVVKALDTGVCYRNDGSVSTPVWTSLGVLL